jgi:hypothetical protein
MLRGEDDWQLQQTIVKIGDELRERIRGKHTREFVVNLIDDVLGKLEPTEIN